MDKGLAVLEGMVIIIVAMYAFVIVALRSSWTSYGSKE